MIQQTSSLERTWISEARTRKSVAGNFKAAWGMYVERLVSRGSAKDADEEILFLQFKEPFLPSEEVAGSVAKIMRSPLSSNIQSYQRTDKAMGVRLKTLRSET